MRRGQPAGDLCHRESGFVQEIAQEVALRSRQNVWVDGSLRDGHWFSSVFADIRRRFPDYKIAIFVVSASEETVRRRVAERERRTGRGVPEELLNASLDGVSNSLAQLTPLADFVARIRNEGVPELKAYETVDHSGNWAVIKARFARAFPSPGSFPQGLAPLTLRAVNLDDLGGHQPLAFADPTELNSPMQHDLIEAQLVLDALASVPCASGRASLVALSKALSTTDMVLSPAHPVHLDPVARDLAGVPRSATVFSFCYPAMDVDWDMVQAQKIDISHPLARLVVAGGFVYFDAVGAICGVNAVVDVGFAITDAPTSRRSDSDEDSDSDSVGSAEAAAAIAAGCGCPDTAGGSDASSHGDHSAETLAQVSMVQFQVPAPLPDEAVAYLIESGRFQAVTLATLLHRGARYFAWIKPNEVLPGMERPPPGAKCVPGRPTPAEHGALAYIFHDLGADPSTGAHQDVYFPIMSTAAAT